MPAVKVCPPLILILLLTVIPAALLLMRLYVLKVCVPEIVCTDVPFRFNVPLPADMAAWVLTTSCLTYRLPLLVKAAVEAFVKDPLIYTLLELLLTYKMPLFCKLICAFIVEQASRNNIGINVFFIG